VPVYIDSPLTAKITEIFKMHPECFDAEARALMRGNDSPFDFPGLQYVEDVEASKALSSSDKPAVIIAASGMCEAGRVLHHLRAGVEDPRNTVLIVGFQAQHTLGRRLVERRARVRIFGVERDRRAEVVVLNGFSAHADQKDLIAFANACRERGPLRKVALVHGEPKAQQVLRELLVDAHGYPDVTIPSPGTKLTL
jgi:metallo-beta-lactamase family protein